MDKETVNTSNEKFEISELLQHTGFKIALKKLIVKLNEIDTVRNIDTEQSASDIGSRQLANKIAVEVIESWLDELLGISNVEEMSEDVMNEEDNIIRRIIDK